MTKILILSLVILAIGAILMLSITAPSIEPIKSPTTEDNTIKVVDEVVIQTSQPIIVPTETVPPINYKVWVDSQYGFYKTRGPNVDNYTHLYVNINDTVTWINDDGWDNVVYIDSQEKLWSGSYAGRLLYNGRQWSYIFNRSGIYNVTVREAKRDNKMIIGVK
ncbi:MAG: hypothetical protein WA130_02145 [Candidatus Methanoperedens sp.]